MNFPGDSWLSQTWLEDAGALQPDARPVFGPLTEAMTFIHRLAQDPPVETEDAELNAQLSESVALVKQTLLDRLLMNTVVPPLTGLSKGVLNAVDDGSVPKPAPQEEAVDETPEEQDPALD